MQHKQNESSNITSSNNNYDCYSNVIDGITKKENLKKVSDAVYRLNNYRDFLAGARKCQREGKGDSNYLHKHLAQRAYMAEADLRTIIKIGIDTLNVVRDFGKFNESISHIAGNVEKSFLTDKNIEETFNEAGKVLGKYYGSIDKSFLKVISTEAKNLFSRHKVEFKKAGKGLKMKFNTADNENRSMIIDTLPTPGHLTRVSSADFFNRNGSKIVASLSHLPLPADCHHATQIYANAHKENAFDVYGSLLGNFALAREMMYNHARKVDEMGIGYFTGNLSVIITLIVIAVVIIIIVVIYYTTGNDVSLVCGTDQNGHTMCHDVDVSQGLLTTSYSATLVGMAISLAGITCSALDNGCSLQTCPVIEIQA